jgi:hypothetical protein
MNRCCGTLLRVVKSEDVVLAENHPGTGFEHDGTLDLASVYKANGAVLKRSKFSPS